MPSPTMAIQTDDLDDGWKENYWDPWKSYLGER